MPLPPAAPKAPAAKADAKDRDVDLLRSFADGETIFAEGDRGGEMFIIERGEVEILRKSTRREKRLAVLRAGEFFGEMSVLEAMPRSAHARAIGETRLLPIDGPTFDRILHEHPEIAMRVMRRLCRRLRELARRTADLTTGRHSAIEAPLEAAVAAAPPPAVGPTGWETQDSDTGPPPVVVGPRLHHTASGKDFPLRRGGESVIGRVDPSTGSAPDVDLGGLDTGRSLSRRHAVIVEREGRFFVREEKPTANGTWVARVKLRGGEELELHDGETLRVASLETVFRLA